MKLKLLTLAGLCAILIGLSSQSARADCTPTWGMITYSYPNYVYDTGCWREGTVTEGFVCTYEQGGNCYGGIYYYNCPCF